MKGMKKLVALLLAFSMVASMVVAPASAAISYTTVTNPGSYTSNDSDDNTLETWYYYTSDASMSNQAMSTSSSGKNIIIAENGATVNLDNLTIRMLTNADGSDTCDFTGKGTAIAAYDSGTTITLTNSEITTAGVATMPLFVDNGATMTVKNTVITSKGGTLNSDYVNTVDQSAMVTPPWCMGIMGTSRAANLMGTKSTLNFLDSEAYAGAWAVLSTDSCYNTVMNIVNSKLELLNSDESANLIQAAGGQLTTYDNPFTTNYGTGYGTYVLGESVQNVIGSTFNVGTYAAVFTGGTMNFSASEVTTYTLSNADGTTTTYQSTVAQRSVINSDCFGFMAHMYTNCLNIEGTDITTGNAVFLIKTGYCSEKITVTVTDSTIETANNVLIQLLDSEEDKIGIADTSALAFATSYSESAGWTTSSYSSSAGSNAQVFKFYNMALSGNIYNGSGTQLQGQNLIVTLSNVVYDGAVASTSVIHINETGEKYLINTLNGYAVDDASSTEAQTLLANQMTTINISNYYYLGHVANLVNYNGTNKVILTLTNGTTWYVTGTSLVYDLTISNDSQIIIVGDATLTVNGVVYSKDNLADNMTWVEYKEENYFVLGVDTNRFIHLGLNYAFSDSTYKEKLLSISGFWSQYNIKQSLNGKSKGVCFGICLSMALGNVGLLNFSSVVSSAHYTYWSMGGYSDNSKFEDMLLYYQLIQTTSDGKATASVTNGVFQGRTKLTNFLQTLVETAKESQEWETPCLLSYFWKEDGKTSGHTVVICGYEYDYDIGVHVIKIYNPNIYLGTDSTLTYYYFYVDSTYSSFSYSDCTTDNHHLTLSEDWVELKVYDVDKILNVDRIFFGTSTASIASEDSILRSVSALSVDSVNSILSSTSTLSVASEDAQTEKESVVLEIPADTAFVLTNAEGEYLSYDGENYDWTMTVEDCQLSGLDTSLFWQVTVAASESFTLTDMEDGCTLVMELNGEGYAVTASGAETICISTHGVTITGEDIEYDICLSAFDEEYVLYHLVGEAEDEVTVFKNYETETIGIEGVSTNVTLYSYDGDEFELTACENWHSYTVTETIAATSTTEGVMTYTCTVCGDTYTETIAASGSNSDTVTTEGKSDTTTDTTSTTIVNPFTDIKSSNWYYEAVLWAAEDGITTGTTDTTFSPSKSCTRAQIVTFLWRMAGSPEPESTENPFTDVKSTAYYYKAVLWAVEQGITNGTSATKFSPNQACTRAQAVTFLYRFAGSPSVSKTDKFSDVKSGAYYASAVAWAVENGITNGTTTTKFSPNTTCNRAMIVTFLYRYEQNIC